MPPSLSTWPPNGSSDRPLLAKVDTRAFNCLGNEGVWLKQGAKASPHPVPSKCTAEATELPVPEAREAREKRPWTMSTLGSGELGVHSFLHSSHALPTALSLKPPPGKSMVMDRRGWIGSGLISRVASVSCPIGAAALIGTPVAVFCSPVPLAFPQLLPMQQRLWGAKGSSEHSGHDHDYSPASQYRCRSIPWGGRGAPL